MVISFKDSEKSINMLNLNLVICSILNINLEAFEKQLQRGTRPVKAAIKLGACPRKAQIVATLKLATTVEEINTVYANTKVLSCMTGKPVGEFYSRYNVGVIYSDMFRTLVNLDTKTIGTHSYGVHGEKGLDLLEKVLTLGDVLPLTKLKLRSDKVTATYTEYKVAHVSWKVTTLNCDSKLTHQEEAEIRFLADQKVYQELDKDKTTRELIVLKSGRLLSIAWFYDTWTEDNNDWIASLTKPYIPHGSRNTVRAVISSRELTDYGVYTDNTAVTVELSFEEPTDDVFIPYLDNDWDCRRFVI